MSFDQPRGHRRSIRLPGYDYSQPGAYFVTLCTQDRECIFDDPVLRHVAESMWQQVSIHFTRASLDAWIVMPNHLHGIVVLSEDTSAGAKHSEHDTALTRSRVSEEVMAEAHVLSAKASTLPSLEEARAGIRVPPGNASPLPAGVPSGSLAAIIGNYKSITARRINQIRRTPAQPVWQRNYYEHVIRTERALNAIRQYIADNSDRWHLDRYNTQAVGPDRVAAELWRLLRENGE